MYLIDDPKLLKLMVAAQEALEAFQTAKYVWWAAYCPMDPSNEFRREAVAAKKAAEAALTAMDRYAHRKVAA
jgi:hypothetical protein